MLVLTIAGIVLLVINTLIWIASKEEDKDISGFVPQLIRVLCTMVWCWWFFGRAGNAMKYDLYEVVVFDAVAALIIGGTCVLAAIEAVKDARYRHWF